MNVRRSYDFSRGFDLRIVRPIESLRTARNEDISKIIPSNMRPTTDGTIVATQILDHSISNWFNSELGRQTALGRTAHQVEKSLESDVKFGGKKPKSIQHSVKFSLKATQTRADIEYSGLTNAQVSYYIAQDKTDIEIREPVKPLNTQLVFNHITSRDDTRQVVSFRWDW